MICDSTVLVEIIDALLIIWFSTSTRILAVQSLDDRSMVDLVSKSVFNAHGDLLFSENIFEKVWFYFLFKNISLLAFIVQKLKAKNKDGNTSPLVSNKKIYNKVWWVYYSAHAFWLNFVQYSPLKEASEVELVSFDGWPRYFCSLPLYLVL